MLSLLLEINNNKSSFYFGTQFSFKNIFVAFNNFELVRLPFRAVILNWLGWRLPLVGSMSPVRLENVKSEDLNLDSGYHIIMQQ